MSGINELFCENYSKSLDFWINEKSGRKQFEITEKSQRILKKALQEGSIKID